MSSDRTTGLWTSSLWHLIAEYHDFAFVAPRATLEYGLPLCAAAVGRATEEPLSNVVVRGCMRTAQHGWLGVFSITMQPAATDRARLVHSRLSLVIRAAP